MQTPLTQDEMISAEDLKIQFSRVLEDISIVDVKIKNLQTEAGHLLTKLENLRNSEKAFMTRLSDKYGSGALEPFKLIYHRE